MELFLKAEAAKHDRSLDLRTLPSGTLQQYLIANPGNKEIEIFFLFPWDLCVELDWRTGVNEPSTSPEGFLLEAGSTIRQLGKRRNARLLFMPAPIPPVFVNHAVVVTIAERLNDLMRMAGAHFLGPEAFDFGNLLNSSFPIRGNVVGTIAKSIIDLNTGLHEGILLYCIVFKLSRVC